MDELLLKSLTFGPSCLRPWPPTRGSCWGHWGTAPDPRYRLALSTVHPLAGSAPADIRSPGTEN